jgi:hypothetical protein
MTPDNYWKQVSSSKDSSSEPRFPNLLPCISLLLCLPFSNAPVERGFSPFKLKRNPIRPNKKQKRQIKSSKLVFQEKTASEVNFPNNLILKTQQVKANLAVKPH